MLESHETAPDFVFVHVEELGQLGDGYGGVELKEAPQSGDEALLLNLRLEDLQLESTGSTGNRRLRYKTRSA